MDSQPSSTAHCILSFTSVFPQVNFKRPFKENIVKSRHNDKAFYSRKPKWLQGADDQGYP